MAIGPAPRGQYHRHGSNGELISSSDWKAGMRTRFLRLLTRKPRATRREGQAMVEFALVSMIFLTVVFGSIDIGRAVYMYEQMHNAVRDSARVAKVYPGNGQGALNQSLVQTFVYNYRSTDPNDLNAERPRPGMSGAVVSFSCSAGCAPATGTLTVTAKLPFSFLLPSFLKLPFSSFTMTASATVDME
jgi:Flp pilus assembly protein TadG